MFRSDKSSSLQYSFVYKDIFLFPQLFLGQRQWTLKDGIFLRYFLFYAWLFRLRVCGWSLSPVFLSSIASLLKAIAKLLFGLSSIQVQTLLGRTGLVSVVMYDYCTFFDGKLTVADFNSYGMVVFILVVVWYFHDGITRSLLAGLWVLRCALSAAAPSPPPGYS